MNTIGRRACLGAFVLLLGVGAFICRQLMEAPNEIWIQVERPFVFDSVDFRAYDTASSREPIPAAFSSYGRAIMLVPNDLFHRTLKSNGLGADDEVWYRATRELIDVDGRTMARFERDPVGGATMKR